MTWEGVEEELAAVKESWMRTGSKGHEIVILAGVGVVVISQKKPSKAALRKICAHLFPNASPWVKHAQEMKTAFQRRASFSPWNTFAVCFWELEHTADSPKLAVSRQKNVLLDRKHFSLRFSRLWRWSCLSQAEQGSHASCFLWNSLEDQIKASPAKRVNLPTVCKETSPWIFNVPKHRWLDRAYQMPNNIPASV